MLVVAALWFATLVAYSNSFRAGLVFDSQRVILADSRLQATTATNARLIWTGDYYYGTGAGALYRPLTTFTYFLNYSVFGNGPNSAGYHRTNFLLHAINLTLVYLLGLLIFQELWAAFAFAALWGLHPILTESVTNVVGRADLLVAFGVLAGLLCFRRVATAGGWRRLVWLIALALCSAIGVFSKESGVVLLGVMVVCDLGMAPRASWSVRMAAYCAAALPALIYFPMRGSVLTHVSSAVISFCDNPLMQAGFWAGRLTAVRVLGKYLFLLLWPGGLSADYSYNQIPLFGWRFSTWEDVQALLSLVLWIAIFGAAVFSYRRAKPVFFFALFFFVTIAPTSNIFVLAGSIMAERFAYLPAIGFAGCVVWMAQTAYRRAPATWPAARKVWPVALAVVCCALAARTYARNLDWQDERSLWSSAVRWSPGSYKAHQNMATVLLSQPQPDLTGATRELEQALTILDPLPPTQSVSSVYATAGLCYRTQGEFNKALAVLTRGRAIDRAWNAAVTERNRLDGKSISAVGTPALYLELGRVYQSLHQSDAALEALRYGRSLDPETEFFEEISAIHRANAETREAQISLLEGFLVDPRRTRLITEVSKLYQEADPGSCAVNTTATGVALNPGCPLVHSQLCDAAHKVFEMYGGMRDPASASNAARGAIQNLGCPAELFR